MKSEVIAYSTVYQLLYVLWNICLQGKSAWNFIKPQMAFMTEERLLNMW